MTNGEKIKEIFPNGVLTSINNSYYWGDDILVSKNWWNAEYKEPTTKNDLGVECIDRAELLKAMDTWDKFGYTTRYGLERLDKDDKGFVPYVKYYDMVNCVKGMSSVTPQESRWIPVSERLPEKNVEVLATTEWGAVTIAEMYSANDWFIHEGTTNAEIDEIVAWMPLPKAYSEGEG